MKNIKQCFNNFIRACSSKLALIWNIPKIIIRKMKKLSKRTISCAISCAMAVVMLATMIPLSSVAVNAENIQTQQTTSDVYVNGDKTYHRTFSSLKNAIENANDGDTIRLIGDIVVTDTINIKKGITLVGDGVLIRDQSFKGIMLNVNAPTKTVVMEKVSIDGNKDVASICDSVVKIGGNSTFQMNSGMIFNNASNNGGGVYNYGTFIMNGGTIFGNVASNEGGGVYNTGIFNIQGTACVTDNTDENEKASNVYLTYDRKVIITGAKEYTGSFGITGNIGTVVVDAGEGHTISEPERQRIFIDVLYQKQNYYDLSLSNNKITILGVNNKVKTVKSSGGDFTSIKEALDGDGLTNIEYLDVQIDSIIDDKLTWGVAVPHASLTIFSSNKSTMAFKSSGRIVVQHTAKSLALRDINATVDSYTSTISPIENLGSLLIIQTGFNIKGANDGYSKGLALISSKSYNIGNGSWSPATMYMSGGMLSENITNSERQDIQYRGGGIHNTGTMYINGGTITENASLFGGGVYNSGKFYFNSGKILENRAIGGKERGLKGGGITNEGTFFEMNAGIVSKNKTNSVYIQGGAGLFLENGTVNGGIISENIASGSSSGGGIWFQGASGKLTGGVIKDNSACWGGGVEIYYGWGDVKIYLEGGSIYNNSVTKTKDSASTGGSGGGVDISGAALDRYPCDVYISDCFIFKNKANEGEYGGGGKGAGISMQGLVRNTKVTLNVKSGAVFENTASTDAGMYIKGDFNLSGSFSVENNVQKDGTPDNFYFVDITNKPINMTGAYSGKIYLNAQTNYLDVRLFQGSDYTITESDIKGIFPAVDNFKVRLEKAENAIYVKDVFIQPQEVKMVKEDGTEIKSDPKTSIYIGDKIQLKLKVTPENANIQVVKWETDYPNVAKITQDGLLSIEAYPGKYDDEITITATYKGSGESTETASGYFKIEFTDIPQPQYTVTIPSEINFGRCEATSPDDPDKIAEKDFQLSVNHSYLYIGGDSVSSFTVSINLNGVPELKVGDVSIPVMFANDEKELAANDKMLYVAPKKWAVGAKDSATIKARLDRSKITTAGNFTGTVNFDIVVTEEGHR